MIGFNDYHGHLQSPGTSGVNAAVPAASRPAVGGVRSPSFDISGATYPYAVSYGDPFTVQPFGNTLMTLNLTAQ